MATIATREYALQALPIRQAREFRKKLETRLNEMGDVIQKFRPEGRQSGDGVEAVQALVKSVSETLLGAPDIMLDLLLEYSPAMMADKEYIEENGFDTEITSAFMEMLGQLYPFGSLISIFRGSVATTTSKNSSLRRTG